MSTRALEAATPLRLRTRSEGHRQWRLHVLARSPLVLLGIVLVVFFVSVAALADELAPADPVAMNAASALQAPSLAAPFGTDRFGRDVLSRAMFGTRASLFVGVGSIVVAATVGTIIGLVSGFFGGALDNLLGRVMDVFFTFPSLILAIAISAALGLGIQNALLAIAVTYWPVFGRLVRGATMAERSKDYVQAAWVVGASGGRIMRDHILPNCLSPIVVQVTVAIS